MFFQLFSRRGIDFGACSHGGRQTVNVSDVALIMRRNKHLLDIVSKAADIDLGDYERPVTKRQRSSNKESTRGRRGARSRTSRPSTALICAVYSRSRKDFAFTGTAMDAAVLRSGTLTPHSDQDANSRSSVLGEIKRETISEQKATTAFKAVTEEDFEDDDVMIVDAPPEQPPLTEKENNVDDDDFSMLDMEPIPATVSKNPAQAGTPISLDSLSKRTLQSMNETPRRSERNALKAAVDQGSEFKAEDSTPQKNLQNSAVAKTRTIPTSLMTFSKYPTSDRKAKVSIANHHRNPKAVTLELLPENLREGGQS
ncbi:hypothetical protein ANCDUO_07829, partial [Ancylostoma duodenale]